MTELHEEFMTLFQTYIKETEDFEKYGKKIAAQRARMALQEIRYMNDNYLEQLGHKATTYFNARKVAIEYSKKWDLSGDQTADLVIISQVWAADLYGESINEDDIAMRLGVQEYSDPKAKQLFLEDDMKNLQLVELFERYINDS